MNVYTVLMKNADTHQTVIQSRTETLTYHDLIQSTAAVCTYLSALRIQSGDRVGILATNSSFWIACYLGILRYGAVAVPIPDDQHISVIHQFLQTTNCNVCFVSAEHHKKFAPLPIEHIITPDDLSQIDVIDLPIYPADDDDLAALMFTSGSTGKPNAVKVSHKNIITNTRSIVQFLDLEQSDRIMVVLPFYYCFGTSLLHTHLMIGGSLVINNQFMFAERVLDDMETYQCTGFAGVPSIYQRLIKRSTFLKRDFPHLKCFQQAGGRLSPNFIEAIVDAFAEKDVFVMYGQTEATARLTYLPPAQVINKMGSIGKAIPYVNIEILNEQNIPIKAGEHGEITASGDSITSGYWQDVPNNRYADGKLHTGDIATIDDEGYIYIVGRKSEFLKPGGNRFSSQKIVDTLLLHSSIIEAAVVGEYDEDSGEQIHAYIGIGEYTLSENEVKRHCLEHLPRFAIPHKITIMIELPKNRAGKVQQQMLLDYDAPSNTV